jgi:hypothetical protein
MNQLRRLLVSIRIRLASLLRDEKSLEPKTPKLEKDESQRSSEAHGEAIQLEDIRASLETFFGQVRTLIERFHAEYQAGDRERQNYEGKELYWTRAAAIAGICFSIASVILSGLTLRVLSNQTYIMGEQAASDCLFQ